MTSSDDRKTENDVSRSDPEHLNFRTDNCYINF